MDKPITLPLVTACPMGHQDNPALTGAATPATLTVQLDTQGGQIYLAPLSEQAAIQLLLALSSWQPVRDYLSGQESNEPPKIQ